MLNRKALGEYPLNNKQLRKSINLIPPFRVILSSRFREMLLSGVVFEGAYLKYQIDRSVELTMLNGPDDLSSIVNPKDGDLAHFTINQESYRFTGSEWVIISNPFNSILDYLDNQEIGFNSNWFGRDISGNVQLSTVIRPLSIDIHVPRGLLNVNFSTSKLVIIGFKDIQTDKIIPAIGMEMDPNAEDYDKFDSELNNTITIPIKFPNTLIALQTENIENLEYIQKLDPKDRHLTRFNYMNDYDIHNNSLHSDLSAGRLVGCGFNFIRPK